MKPAGYVPAAILAALALVLGAASKAIHDREQTLAQGRVVLVQLAPVDPRSLMQGDYMALRFAIDNELAAPDPARRATPARYAVLTLDVQDRARLAGMSDKRPAGEAVAMRIRQRDGRPTIGPNAFFFQEGTADRYEAARWGEFRVAPDGSALLTHLRDADLNRLGEQLR